MHPAPSVDHSDREDRTDRRERLHTAHRCGRLAAVSVARLADARGVDLPDPRHSVLLVAAAAPIRMPKIKRTDSGGPDPHGVGFEAGEHTYLGNKARLSFDSGTVDADKAPLHLPNGLLLTYGQLVALGGDFYGLPDQPISRAPNPEATFRSAFDTLAVNPASVGEAKQILEVMDIEIDAVNKAKKEGRQPSSAYAALGDSLSEKWNVVTGGGSALSPWVPAGRYLDLAATNFDHFGADAVTAYRAGHAAAVGQAVAAGRAPADQRRAALELAYAMNAFADHFLTDLFSSGHLRTPRWELYQDIHGSVGTYALGSLLARYMHDEDSCWGLQVWNAAGETWEAYGDKRLLDDVNAPSLGIAERAVQYSVDEIADAYRTGRTPPAYQALSLIPDLSRVRDYRRAEQDGNFSPLFVARSGSVDRRLHPADRKDYSWTNDWWGFSTYYLLSSMDEFKQCGDVTPPLILTDQLIQIHGELPTVQTYSPVVGAGFRPADHAESLPLAAETRAWLTADLRGTGSTDLVRPYASPHGLGMVVYAWSDGRFTTYWQGDAVGRSSDGRWWLTAGAGSQGGDTIVQARVDTAAIQLDVYGWSRTADGVIRLGGTERIEGPHAPVRDWLATPSGTQLPDLVAVQDVSHTIALGRFEATEDGRYRQVSTTAVSAGDASVRQARTTRNGPTDLVVIGRSGTDIAVFRRNGSGYLLVSRVQVPAPPGDPWSAPFVGDLTGDGLSDIVFLRLNNGRIAAVAYAPVDGVYKEAWRSNDIGLPARFGSNWLPITGGTAGQLALVNCWGTDTLGMDLLVPDGTGRLHVTWSSAKVGSLPGTGAWLAGRLA